MIWLTTVMVVLALGAIALLAAGRGAPMVDEYDDRPDVAVPTKALRGHDLRHLRFAITFRGYRMSEVDALLDRLADELDAAERQVERQVERQRAPERPRDDSDLG